MKKLIPSTIHIDFEVNNNALTAGERVAIGIRNLKKINDHIFKRLTNLHAYYEHHKSEGMSSYSYTSIATWIKRGSGHMDIDFFIWWARELRLPDLTIIGYQDQSNLKTPGKPVNDSIYVDASNADYVGEKCDSFSTTGWYVVEHNNQRKVLHISKTPAGITATNNVDNITINSIDELTFKEKITAIVMT